MTEISPRYKKAEIVTSNSPFLIGQADAIYVATDVTGGLTITLLDNTNLALDGAPAGTTIPIACKLLSFSTGIIMAMRA